MLCGRGKSAEMHAPGSPTGPRRTESRDHVTNLWKSQPPQLFFWFRRRCEFYFLVLMISDSFASLTHERDITMYLKMKFASPRQPLACKIELMKLRIWSCLLFLQFSVYSNGATFSQQMLEIKFETLVNDGMLCIVYMLYIYGMLYIYILYINVYLNDTRI